MLVQNLHALRNYVFRLFILLNRFSSPSPKNFMKNDYCESIVLLAPAILPFFTRNNFDRLRLRSAEYIEESLTEY